MTKNIVSYNYLDDRNMKAQFIEQVFDPDKLLDFPEAVCEISWDDDMIDISIKYPTKMTEKRVEDVANYLRENMIDILRHEQDKENGA